MERIAHGVYTSDDVWPDELYLLSQKNKNAIFSHETALFLHGLMEREPVRISMTVCPNYNATHLRKRGIRVYQVKDELFTLGISNVKTNFGNPVNVYDKERSICDIVKNRRNMDVQTFQTAMLEMEKARAVLEEVIAIEIDDGVSFRITKASDIMEDHDYSGIRFM